MPSSRPRVRCRQVARRCGDRRPPQAPARRRDGPRRASASAPGWRAGCGAAWAADAAPDPVARIVHARLLHEEGSTGERDHLACPPCRTMTLVSVCVPRTTFARARCSSCSRSAAAGRRAPSRSGVRVAASGWNAHVDVITVSGSMTQRRFAGGPRSRGCRRRFACWRSAQRSRGAGSRGEAGAVRRHCCAPLSTILRAPGAGRSE